MTDQQLVIRSRKYFVRSITVLLLGLAPFSVSRADWDWSIGAGATYSDNRFREPVNPEGETSLDALLLIDGEHMGPRLDAALAVNATYGLRLRESKGDVLGGLDTDITYRLLPEYLHFSLHDSFGQIKRALDRPDTPDNRINFNVLSAGPNVIIPFGKRTGLDIYGRWARSYYEEAPANNERKTLGASLNYKLTTFSTISLNASNSRVEYDELDDSFDYDIQEASLRYVRRTQRTTMDVLGGQTRVKYPDSETPASTLVRASIGHDFSERSSIFLNAGTGYTDAGGRFVLDQSISGVSQNALDAPLSTDAFKSDYADLSLRLTGVRVGITSGVRWDRARHNEEIALDSEQRGVYATVSRRTSARVDLRLEGAYGEREFVQTGSTFIDKSIGVGAVWRFSARISFDLELTHLQGARSDVGPVVTPYDFKENRASLRFMYSPAR